MYPSRWTRAFAYYDVASKHWHAEAGKYNLSVGRSSDAAILHGEALISTAFDVANNE